MTYVVVYKLGEIDLKLVNYYIKVKNIKEGDKMVN